MSVAVPLRFTKYAANNYLSHFFIVSVVTSWYESLAAPERQNGLLDERVPTNVLFIQKIQKKLA